VQIEGNNYEIEVSVEETQKENEVCFRAVTKNVPKNFVAALRDPIWGDAARKEFQTVTEKTGTLVKVDAELARENIQQGADVLRMIAVYEEKEKERQCVRKVRLVCDGDINVHSKIDKAIQQMVTEDKDVHDVLSSNEDKCISNSIDKENLPVVDSLQNGGSELGPATELGTSGNPISTDGFEIVERILSHQGSAKKKARMRFKVRWKNFDDSHDSWLPWKDLRGNAVLHNYLKTIGKESLIPKEYQGKRIDIDRNEMKDSDDDSSKASEAERERTSEPAKGQPSVTIALRDRTRVTEKTSALNEKKKSKKGQNEAMKVTELLSHIQSDNTTGEESHFVEWSTHNDGNYYFNFSRKQLCEN
jgi:hypothetical protein